VSREDVQEAQRRISDAVARGSITAEEGAQRSEAVIHAVTPHDLYEMSGGLAGEAHMSRAARREWGKVVWVFVAMGLVAIAMLVILVLVLS
jgi:hypothetical protein